MQPYRHSSSGIAAYSIGDDWIKIRFRDGDTYLYTYSSAGKDNIEQMKALAEKGRGLNTYISRHVRDRYEARL